MNVGAMAVGAHARATVNNAASTLAAEGRADLVAKLQAVLDAIESHGKELPDEGTATQLVERITTEAARKEPDKLTLRSFLGTLADQVKSVSVIASAVTALAGTVGALF
jgi:type VI protein secretion system component VasK